MSERTQIVYEKWTFSDEDIHAGNMYLAMALMSDALEANTFSATVECTDSSIIDFQRNAPLTYYYKGRQRGIFYVQSVTREGPTTYTISATSAIGLLIEGLHYGGIYTGQTVEQVIPSICGTVPYAIKTNLRDIALYGWLPVASPRDNLSQVLFAIGATVKTDLDGVLHIEGLWDGISNTLPKDHMYQGPSVDYEAKVTQVVVTEHQYTEGGEQKELFDGTAQDGDIITFDEPMYNLQATGFAIVESGANYARVTAGPGTLTGNAYIHNTRQVTMDVLAANEPNVVTVTDATLVSLVNSMAVAERVANYYKSYQTINADADYQGEIPGDLLSAWHPYDQEAVSACVESADINLSNTLKASENLLVGFIPPQIAEEEIFENRVVLTGEGDWQVPEGATNVIAVLIDGGAAGQAGAAGEQATVPWNDFDQKSQNASLNPGGTSQVSSSVQAGNGTAGSGGIGGNGGTGGRVLRTSVDVTGINSIHYKCGSAAGYGESTETTFGALTSVNGARSQSGYTDPITGEIYATPGEKGEDGGAGGAAGEDGEGRTGASGGEAMNGGTRTKTATRRQNIPVTGYPYIDYDAEATFQIGSAGGGGAGGKGENGGNAEYVEEPVLSIDGAYQCSAYGYSLRGGDGGNGGDGEDGANYGCGGSGGCGGGGAGANGNISVSATLSATASEGDHGSLEVSLLLRTSANPRTAANAGTGGAGGAGAAGCVIIYYGIPETVGYGQLVTSDQKYFIDRFNRRLVV